MATTSDEPFPATAARRAMGRPGGRRAGRRAAGMKAGGLAALLLLLTVAPGPASADQAAEVVRLADQGQYQAAAQLSRDCGTPESLAEGAGALSVFGGYVAPEAARGAVLREAVALANKARRRAEAEGVTDDDLMSLIYFQEGQAIGRLAETLPEEERKKYADEIRDYFEESLKHDPQRWEAHTGLANWHAKVMVAADSLAGGIGAFLANVIYDATFEEAEMHRDAAAAIAKPPAEQKVFLLESAEIRLLLDENGMAEAARRDLEASLAIEPPNHLTTAVHRIAQACLDDLTGCALRLRAALE